MASNLRVLVVDDSSLLRRAVIRVLKEGSLSVCGEASTCMEAIRVAAATVPDVILLDLNLPDARGPETAKLIREKLPEIPIVVMSAEERSLLSLLGQEAGADAWLEKSRVATDLVPIIQKLCPA